MRLILTILLIGLFKADAQMVINASAPYRSSAVNIFAQTSNTYSLRKVITSYTGSAIRVRKDTTGQPEQDIGFLGSGELDTVSLKSFLNARSGFAVTWYSQNNNQNATQATAANQPRIALNGVIDRLSGKPTLLFDGSNDVMTVSSFNNNALSLYIVFSRATGAPLGSTILRKGLTTNVSLEFALRNNVTTNVLEGVASTGAATMLSSTSPNALGGNQIRLGILIFDNSNVKVGLDNNALVSSALSGNLFQGTAPLIIGAGPNNEAGTTFAGIWTGRISEILIYGADKTSDNESIKTDIDNFYNIY